MNSHQFNIETLDSGCEQLGITLSESQRGQLLQHLQLLSQWNRKLNLTAITDTREMIISHLLDSLAILPWVKGASLLDIGSGAGFPGVPLAIVWPKLKVSLLDSRRKRVEFLRHLQASLGLANIEAMHSRIENYRPGTKFDTLVCRAFASIPRTLELIEPLEKGGSRLLLMKGRLADEEIEQLNRGIRKRLSNIRLDVPFLEAERRLVIIEYE